MLRINKKVEYSLIVLKHFNDNDVSTTAREVCESYGLPFDTTSKVMQTMKMHKILESTQGVKGGYRVSCDLAQLSFLELSELVEGRNLSHDCQNNNCSIMDTCNIAGPIQKLDQYLITLFKTLSIEELLTTTGITGDSIHE